MTATSRSLINPLSRALKIIAITLVWSLLLFLAYALGGNAVIGPLIERWQAKRALSAASTPQQLQAAVGRFGAFYSFPDGAWMAIRYEDSHAGVIWSLATARDSGGNWYESREHFCGAFRATQTLQRLSAKAGEPFEPADDRGRWLVDLSSSPDLQTARERVTSRYFTKRQ